MSKTRSLCKFSKHEIEDNLEQLAKVTRNSSYICRKCARSAEAKKWLCKPVAI